MENDALLRLFLETGLPELYTLYSVDRSRQENQDKHFGPKAE